MTVKLTSRVFIAAHNLGYKQWVSTFPLIFVRYISWRLAA